MSSETLVAGVGPDRPSLVGAAGVVALVGVAGPAAAGTPWEMLVVSWVAFAAMGGRRPSVPGARARTPSGWYGGTASPAGRW